jgi:type I restriction enzyme S subunit
MTTFRDLIRAGVLAIGDGYRAKNDELGGDGPIFLRSGYLQDTGWVLENADRFITKNKDKFGEKLAKDRDTVVTTKGNSVGRVGIIDGNTIGSIYSPHLSYWRTLSPDCLAPLYIYYWARSPSAQNQIRAYSGSTDMAPYLSLADQLRISIYLPPHTAQLAVCDILGALDQKISVNRRMTETLEAMARAIYKSWFVDFEPVRAKAMGHPTGLPVEFSDIFPANVGDDGLPVGWRSSSLQEFSDLNPENWSSSNYPSEIRYADLSGTKLGSIEVTEVLHRDSAPSRAQRVLRIGDTIVGVVRPGNKSYAFVGEDGITGSTGFAVLRPKAADYRELVYLAATAPENIERLAHLADGAAYPAVRSDVVLSTVLSGYAADVVELFSKTVAPLIDRITLNRRQNRTLAALRDTLLPKLISGELHIADAERLAGVV